MLPNQKASDKKSESLNIKGYQRHIILCAGPKCCQQSMGQELWDYLKDRLNQKNLANVREAPVFRTKAACLRICADGPIAVVYPEGTWYRLLDKKGIDCIIENHLLKGQEVPEYKLEGNRQMASCLSQEMAGLT